jgi:hypothetical protein
MAQNTNQNNPQQQKEFNDAVNEYRSLLRNITDELGKQRSFVVDANAEYRKLDSIAKQIQNTEEGLNGLTSEQLDKLKQKAQYSLAEISNRAKQLLAQKGLNGLTNQELQIRLKSKNLSEQELALIQAHIEGYKLETEFLDIIEDKTRERIKYEEKIQSLTGATGAILDGMGGAMKGLGLGAAAQYLQVDKAKEAMQQEADAIARGEKEGGKLQVRMAGIKVLADGLKKSLFSVEAIVGFIASALLQGSKNMAAFQKQTGMSYESAYKLNTEMNAVAAGTGDAFITGEKLGKAYASLTEELGVSADILGGKALVSATNLEQRLGMSAEQSSKLTVFARLQGKDTEKVLSNATATVGAFNNQNKTAINVKAVMDDVANASKATYLNMGKNVTALTQAATKAKSLGLSLKDLETVSESLLDFESSIGNELQAQLLTGGNINLAKAREYALTGDMKGLGDEIGKQQGILNAFRKKDVVAQNAAAAALGLTREKLAEMTMQQELNTLGAENFKKQYGESAYESMKARDAAQGFGDAMEKIKSVLGSIFQAFSPLLDGIVMLLNIPFVPQLLAGAILIKTMGGGLFKMATGMGGFAKSIFGAIKNFDILNIKQSLFGKMYKGGQFLPGGGRAAAGGQRVGGLFGGATDKAADAATDAKDKIAGGSKGGFKSAMKDVAGGLKEMGAKGVVQGIINLALAGPALVIALPSIPFLLFMGKVDLKTLPANFKALAEGLSSMKDTFIGSAALAAFGIAGTIAIPSLIFLGGVAAIGAAAKVGLEMLAAGLKALGKGAAEIIIGIGILAAFNVAMIPFAYAMGLAAPYIEAFGVVITSVFTGLATLVGAVADGFIKLMEAVSIEKILPMMLLGPALVSIAAGLMAIGGAGIMAIPGIMGLTALALISPALVSLADAFGMGGESAGEAKGKADEGSMAAVEAKLTELIAVVKAGGNVLLRH